MRFLSLAALLCLGVAWGASSPVQRTESKEGDERVIILQNERLKLVIFPDLGGRIGRIVDLTEGDELLYWDLSPHAVYHGEGGALDDRRNTFVPYNVVPPPKEAPEGAVHLSWSDKGITIAKTISILPLGSTIRADYLYRNASQQALKDYEVMTKNWFLPGGGPITPKDLYCLPTSRGVRRIQGFNGNWSYPELRGKFQQDVGPWNGIVNTEKRRGVAVAFSNDYYRWFYMWKVGVEIPTYEWVFGELPPGQEVKITIWMHVVHGMGGYSFANAHAVTNLEYDPSAGLIKSAVFSADRALMDARIETEIRRLPDGLPVRIGDISLGSVPLAAVREGNVSWKPQGEGTYVVRQRLLDSRTIIAEYEEPIAIGKSSGEYVRPQLFPARAQFASIPAWQPIPPKDIAQPGPADLKRGYMIYLDAFAPSELRGKPAERYTLHMGQGECKTFGFKIRALADLNGMRLSAAAEGLKPAQVELFGIERIDVSDAKVGKTGQFGEKLIPWSAREMKKGDDHAVWVRIRTTASDVGEKRVRIRVAAEGREPCELDAAVKVWPVALPRPNLISLEAEHSTMILPGCWDAKARAWRADVIERYARDLGEHLTDFEQGFWGWFEGPRDNGMLRLATTGQPLQEFLKTKPNLANPPPLDFSYLNPVFDAAIQHGMVRFSTNCSRLPPPEIGAWVMREAARYLRDRGYPAEDIWCKYLDEQPPTRHPKMVEDVQWLKSNGYRPYSTFHNIIDTPQLMATLKRGFEMFQGGFTTHAARDARLKEGNLDPASEIWMYQGWGATWIPYEHDRRPGWFAAAAKLDGYHVHVYYRWHPLDAIIFPSEEGPASSPAWEAIRDGMADAQYVALAARWIQRLERANQTDLARQARTRLANIVGGNEALIRLERKRDRLNWVERIDSLELPTAEAARGALLSLLADLMPHVAKLGPSLYYGSYVLAEDGKIHLALARNAHKAGAELLAAELQKRFGVRLTAIAEKPEFSVELQVGQIPESWRNADLHVTDLYPPSGEYVIHVLPAGKDFIHMLIFGRDEEGLRKGIQMWLCFLRTERRGGTWR